MIQLDFVLNSPLFDHRTSEEKAENPGIPQVEEYYDLVPDGTSYRFRPGDTYIAPISGFPFSDGPIYKSYRPTKELADTLIAHYWRCVHPVARTIHKPSFERAYGYFWEGRHTPTSTQALIFAAMFSAIVSMPKDHPAIHQFRDGQMNLSVILQSSTEALLGRAHLARTTKLETVQAAVTYLVSKVALPGIQSVFDVPFLSCFCVADVEAKINAMNSCQAESLAILNEGRRASTTRKTDNLRSHSAGLMLVVFTRLLLRQPSALPNALVFTKTVQNAIMTQ